MAKKRKEPEAETEAPPALAPRPPSFVIAPGCSMSCSGRIRGPGSAVSPADLHNDPAVARTAFDSHIESGVIVEAK
jgi:hypothetical protein